MNSFFVPRLGSQIYAMAGMASQLWLQADEPGTFDGFSANFSGRGFRRHALPREGAAAADGYAKWIADAKASGADLDRNRYAELVKPSMAVGPSAYRSVEPGLFQSDRQRNARRSPPRRSGPRLRRRVRRRRSAGEPDARQAHLGRDPVRPADPARHLDRGGRHHPRRARPDHVQGLVALSVARVDHLGRPQAHRRHVLPARRSSCWCAASPTRS